MVAVNLSGSSLCDPEFRAFAEERMRALACPNVLCLEITDGPAITDFVPVNAFIARARALGCRFALHDFGSGLSSFAYLRRLPVDYVRIDGQFVRDASPDRKRTRVNSSPQCPSRLLSSARKKKQQILYQTIT